jgi:hypothetical protein
MGINMAGGDAVIKKFVFSIILGLLFVLSAADEGPAVKGKSDALNGGFEEPDAKGQFPKGWEAASVPGFENYYILAWDSSISHGGKHSVSIRIKDSHPEAEVFYNWFRRFKPFKVGSVYEISGWIRTENVGGTAAMIVQFIFHRMGRDYRQVSTQQDFPVSGTSDWTFVKKTFTVPEETGEVYIRVGIGTPESIGGQVWFDDLTIEEVEKKE